MDLRDLYQEIIIDHNRNPRNHRSMEHPTCEAKGFNPLCGDKLTVYLKLRNNKIDDISFLGCGCAISQASASLMTEVLRHKTIEEAHDLFRRFHHMVTVDEEQPQTLDKLAVLAGVRTFPARVKCATLAWHTLESALNQEKAMVTTE
ncbi:MULTISPECIES: Fe-S cluster assembly sulfur transfer protein SufU [Legionella]|uniref:SUF system NifU family Fe-S cluster assembly protein n=1 Tax=Legionella septentrionalis TaxID=2498109 RepID=A0A433JMK3_9GAMM|nr:MULTISPECIES: SUF system NifU family Fe-S cluster assembly protein [Legionella]MCP0913120.1 SUF system NifU family Fe-S cluster assembly protein [Legionella sp. 27cVA30]RUQ91569.1 SUF system NifU family Fe-S cluster assembly protein [Legionella septentrionalis]RUR02494.1 SUF system NifU family Fe-S cluster assembly protein [Legionella septentrionalis]RUR10619.1 SUF system NifU family Fe-S cluster assembly protein [Legionella septentrionalis]RUR17152.1 SUF system NifU family Fe-S cluster ass